MSARLLLACGVLWACAPEVDPGLTTGGATSTGAALGTSSTGGTSGGCGFDNTRCTLPDAGIGACCGGACRDVQWDLTNCGVCGVLCAKACLAGQCEE